MFLQSSNASNRKWRDSIDPYLGELSEQIDPVEFLPKSKQENSIRFYNRETQKNAEDAANKGFGGEEFSFQSQSPVWTGVSDLVPQQTTEESKSLQLGRISAGAAPERDAMLDTRMKKIAKIRAIAQGASLLSDIISNANGGVVAGPIGGNDDFMNHISQIDADYARRLQQHSRQVFDANKFNAGVDNQEALQNYKAVQDKIGRDYNKELQEDEQEWMSGENDKKRAASKRQYTYNYKSARLNDRKMDDKRLQEAIEAGQEDISRFTKSLESLESDDPQRETLLKQIDDKQSRIDGMEVELAKRAGYEHPQEQPGPRVYKPDEISTLRGLPIETSSGVVTVGEMLKMGVPTEDIANFLNN